MALDGVSSASVSLMANSGRVEFDERRVDVPAIMAAITSLGYEVEVSKNGSGVNVSSYDREARRWRRDFLGSLVFTAPVFILSMVLKHMDPFHDALLHEIVPEVDRPSTRRPPVRRGGSA